MSIFDTEVKFPNVDSNCGMEPSLREILIHYYSQVLMADAAAASAKKYIDLLGVEAELARLRAEAEANRVDAERYRWLRNDAMTGTKHDPAVLKDGPTDCCEFMFGDELDAAIDAAMGASA